MTFLLKAVLLLKVLNDVKSQFMPGMPGGPPMPQMPFPSMQMGSPMGSPLTMGQPMPLPMGMPSPMHMGGMPMMAQPKLPMVVMPFQKKDTSSKKKSSTRSRYSKKKRHSKKYRPSSIETDESDGSGSEEYARRNGRRSGGKSRKHNVLTPVISYVTRDGYVVYQKKIKKDKAKEWLDIGRRSNNNDANSETGSSSEEALRKALKKKLKKAKRKHNL